MNGTCNRLRQNKANLPGGRPRGAGWANHQRSRRCGVWRQTNPIWSWRPGRGAGDRESPPRHDGAKQSQLPEAGHRGGVRRRNGRGKWLAGKELWYIVPAIGFGKTKPIPRQAGGVRGAKCAKQTQFLDFGLRIMQTKPIARSGIPGRCPPRASAMDLESAPEARRRRGHRVPAAPQSPQHPQGNCTWTLGTLVARASCPWALWHRHPADASWAGSSCHACLAGGRMLW